MAIEAVGDAVRQCGAAVGYGTYCTKGNTLEGLPLSVRGLRRAR
jgi:hypothetical protein